MTSNEIRQRFLDFFEKRGHKIIPSASLVTSDEKGVTNSTLFNTAGMQPLIPYLLGKKHPLGTRLADSQKCVRTVDIDSVGDSTHLTFFEMLGNWSLGDYFKEDAIKWSFELLTSKEEGFGLDPKRLYITVFEGDENAPRDDESAKIWQSVGIPENRIYFMPADSNWWQAGDNGPCGPDTEMFYDLTEDGLGDLTKEEFVKADSEQKVVEIWNDVFMEYEKKDGKVIGKLPNKNVDTGSGLERLTTVLQKKNNVFETDIFEELMEVVKSFAKKDDEEAIRIVVDHLKAGIFLVTDGVEPSKTGRGYIVRRLLRRVMRNKQKVGITERLGKIFVDVLCKQYGDTYPELIKNKENTVNILSEERELFQEPLDKLESFREDLQAYKDNDFVKKIKDFSIMSDKDIVSADYIYQNYQSYGVPYDLSIEIINELGLKFEQEKFDQLLKDHQELSRKGAEQKFKGGLADTSNEVVRYHTATHLLHQALRDVLGDHVSQKGSNITAERLRFDFTHGEKMTDEQKQKVEEIVNQKIKEALPVQKIILPIDEAEKTGALHFFGEKYGDEVSIYFVGKTLESAYSKEFCGGPHVTNTSELDGTFKIKKEESVAQGIRRIKAVLV